LPEPVCAGTRSSILRQRSEPSIPTSLQKPDGPGASREGSIAIASEDDIGLALDPQWVDAIRIGIEIASSPYPGINRDGPCITVSDQGNNAGLVLGPEVGRELWSDLDRIDVSMFVDECMVGRATTATMLDGPFGAVRFLLANLRQRAIAPQGGWWVSSGAITGVHEIRPGSRFEAVFEGIGRVRSSAAGF
jgi:2-keto-4-pentenoate hydratase